MEFDLNKFYTTGGLKYVENLIPTFAIGYVTLYRPTESLTILDVTVPGGCHMDHGLELLAQTASAYFQLIQ